MVPGLIGGADWAGAAADPERSVLYVPSHTLPSLARLGTPRGHHSRYAAYTDERIRGPQGLPLTEPPYGRITAIDMRTGDHLWMRALGSGPVNHPALQGLDLPDLGGACALLCWRLPRCCWPPHRTRAKTVGATVESGETTRGLKPNLCCAPSARVRESQ